MQVRNAASPGLLLLQPTKFADDRGWFVETWNERHLFVDGQAPRFLQDNHSFSTQKHTLRGMHFQRPPFAQAKLVRCTRGTILDVVVDARNGSPTYQQCFSFELSEQNQTQLYVPEGFLHGFLTLQEASEIQYKCTQFYNAEADGSVHWQSIGFDWPLKDTPVVSHKDQAAMDLQSLPDLFQFEGDS